MPTPSKRILKVRLCRSRACERRDKLTLLNCDFAAFLEGGKALEGFIKNKLITMGGTELIKRTALAAVYAGVALPLTIYNTSSLALDSDFSRCKVRRESPSLDTS